MIQTHVVSLMHSTCAGPCGSVQLFVSWKRNTILGGEGRGWDPERRHPTREAVLQTICSFNGQREPPCPRSVKVFFSYRTKREGIQST